MEALLLRDRKFVVPAFRTRCDASKPIASEFMMRVISNYYKKTSPGVWQTLTISNQQTHTPVQSLLCPSWSALLRTPGASTKSLALAPRRNCGWLTPRLGGPLLCKAKAPEPTAAVAWYIVPSPRGCLLTIRRHVSCIWCRPPPPATAD